MVREQPAIGVSIASTTVVNLASIAGHSMLGTGAGFSSGRSSRCNPGHPATCGNAGSVNPTARSGNTAACG